MKLIMTGILIGVIALILAGCDINNSTVLTQEQQSTQLVLTSPDSDFTYTLASGKAQIREYKGAGGAVTIPRILDGFPVTSIGFGAFEDCSGLTSISIPQGVTDIGTYAFAGCSDLTSVNIPESVTSIGNGSFFACTRLISISIPKSVTSIDNSTFFNCESLNTIKVAPDNMNFVNIDGVLYDKSGTLLIACTAGLTSIIIPESVTTIGLGAFGGCNGLTTINLPQGVTRINDHAFDCCKGLTTISIPQGVTSIGLMAFYICPSLTTITFNSATTTIEDREDSIQDTTTIIGHAPSTAKTYATKYNRKFEVIK